eukprot:TRINITY_DN13858_c0_g1_i15.p1 TRINITY_DN13858_c0_g1~~TRINITY_DN13858_c0_g1_i15.p1  ORF type:complete len:168 (+),score=12.97 TRINITY_DN13858_c0_g1_i15:101-604(+)
MIGSKNFVHNPGEGTGVIEGDRSTPRGLQNDDVATRMQINGLPTVGSPPRCFAGTAHHACDRLLLVSRRARHHGLCMIDSEMPIIESPLSRTVSRDGVTVRVNIFRVGDDPLWAMEVVNEAGTSIVWDDVFPTDEAAFAVFAQTVATEGMATFLGGGDAMPSGATLH